MRHIWLTGEGHCHDVFHRKILAQERLDVELNYAGFRGGEFLNVELSQKDSRTKKLIRIPVSPQQPRHFQPLLCSPEVIQLSRRLSPFTYGRISVHGCVIKILSHPPCKWNGWRGPESMCFFGVSKILLCLNWTIRMEMRWNVKM